MVLPPPCCVPAWTNADHRITHGVAVSRPTLQAAEPHRACRCVWAGPAHRHRADRLSQHRGVRGKRALGVTYVRRHVNSRPGPGRARPDAARVAWVLARRQPRGLSLIHISEPTRLLSISYA